MSTISDLSPVFILTPVYSAPKNKERKYMSSARKLIRGKTSVTNNTLPVVILL